MYSNYINTHPYYTQSYYASPHNPNINTYSFAMHPEEYQPSGSVNFSRISNVSFGMNDYNNFIYHQSETLNNDEKNDIEYTDKIGYDYQPQYEKITNETIECPVCLDNKNNLIKLKCSHIFCEDCVSKIAHDGFIRCPLCRKEQLMTKNNTDIPNDNGVRNDNAIFMYNNFHNIVRIAQGMSGLIYSS